jgi:DNA repair protein RadC
MPFVDFPPPERPRERFLRSGPDSLTDTELLALILGVGHGSENGPLTPARRIVNRFRDLRRLAQASVPELCEIPGIGVVQACRIRAALALAGRLHQRPFLRGEPLESPAVLFRRFGQTLVSCEREAFVILALDSRHRLIGEPRVQQGGFCTVEIVPRDVFAHLAREGAAAAIFMHNHPSGDPNPSEADRMLTWRLADVGSGMGVRVLDHVIIGRERYFSFAEQRAFHPG